MNNITTYFEGEKLYGDDFSLTEIENWFNNEKEGYANLGYEDKGTYKYSYTNINQLYGFNYIPKNASLKVALGIGSAFGGEFLPVIERISELHIIEPSEYLVSEKIGNITPSYHMPEMSGKINFPDNSFDFITCFSVLHHIPNVSYVMGEIYRCLKPGGYLLIKEPITSMGDWRHSRPGLTKDERGIPLQLFRNLITALKFIIIKESLCFSMTAFLTKLFRRPVYTSKLYLKFDKILSKALSRWSFKYHRVNFIDKIGPGAVFYVLSK